MVINPITGENNNDNDNYNDNYKCMEFSKTTDGVAQTKPKKLTLCLLVH